MVVIDIVHNCVQSVVVALGGIKMYTKCIKCIHFSMSCLCKRVQLRIIEHGILTLCISRDCLFNLRYRILVNNLVTSENLTDQKFGDIHAIQIARILHSTGFWRLDQFAFPRGSGFRAKPFRELLTSLLSCSQINHATANHSTGL